MQRPELDRLLTQMLATQDGISDLLLTVGHAPQVEAHGRLIAAPTDPPLPRLTPFQTDTIALALLNGDRRLTDGLLRTGSCDLSYALAGVARFRVNIFQQRGRYSIVLRRLPLTVPTLATLDLPPVLAKFADERNGLILVAGATGAGKSTTLAGILDRINERQAVHVITLEDPVEFLHPPKQATFNQRELGTDFESFANGLRAALRQACKVILVGELRDRETIEIALAAAETGHLVLSSLHTTDAGTTIHRILGFFEHAEERQIRLRLADSLRWVVCQRLLPRLGGGRVAAVEIMGKSLRVQEVIRNGESEGKTFYEIIADGDALGMQTFDTHLLAMVRSGLISAESALSYASNRAAVVRGVDTLKATTGEKTSDIEGLALDMAYGRRAGPRSAL